MRGTHPLKTPFQSPAVSEKFTSYPPAARRSLLELRELVFETARSLPEVGEIEETLKWGEPAYLTRNGAGSTIRMDWKPKSPDQCALYFHCRTGLVERFRDSFAGVLSFEKNRAIVFPIGSDVPKGVLRECIAASLTYHLGKRRNA